MRAIEQVEEIREIHIVGGVAANQMLKRTVETAAAAKHIRIRTPLRLQFCTDNGAMIAAAGTFLLKEKPDMRDAPFETVATVGLETVFHTHEFCSAQKPRING